MRRIGVAGLGSISKVYLDNLTEMFGERVKLTAIADNILERAEKTAAHYHVQAFQSDEEMAKNSKVDIVLNLTPPNSHFKVALAAVQAGKHVYTEKPLCTRREDAIQLLAAAAKKKVRIGSAPDTFLGAGIQTCRKLIDDGVIGRPVAATAFMMNRGPEHWHPAPEFFYQPGAGPLFDAGPYYLTALINLLGPVVRVCGSAQTGIKTRTISSEPLIGVTINVETPTHIAGVLDFACGAVGTLITSFEAFSHTLPWIEIYGTEGTLRVPDPNTFGGPVYVKRFRAGEWQEVPLIEHYADNSRGLGLVEMALSIEKKHPHRASEKLAFHVLDIMQGILEASASEQYYHLSSTCERPAAMENGLSL
jgi:predicted dehydrogenase